MGSLQVASAAAKLTPRGVEMLSSSVRTGIDSFRQVI